MAGPIKPSEVPGMVAALIPEEVFEAFNELIAKNWEGGQAKVIQKDVVALATDKIQRRDETFVAHMFDFKWLNVEASYRNNGWQVTYDKPGYNESYDASFTFKPSRSKRGGRGL